jgi:glycosyltransferase involved in cell wall biosynthesis
MERYALTVIGGLLEKDVKVAAFCRAFDTSLPETKRLRDSIHCLKPWWVPGKFRDAWFSRRLDRERKRLKLDAHIGCCLLERPDIAVCGGTHRGYLAAIGKRPDWFDLRKIALEERQYANARLIVAHSPLMVKELISLYGADEGKIHLLYPPVDAGRFRLAGAEERVRLRSGFGFPEDRKIFLLVSGSHVRKGLPFLRRYFEKTELPILLAVAGRETEPGRNILSLGRQDRMERLYQAADAVVMASTYEPFGLAAVEAVLCGTPVFLADNTGCLEAIRPVARRIFRAGDEDSLAKAMREMLSMDRVSLPHPSEALAYDPGVSEHVEALLEAA